MKCLHHFYTVVFTLICHFPTLFIFSQPIIKGRVVDAEHGTGIPGCSVFISGTSKGTSCDTAGYFSLDNVPEGKYELVFSSIGYETNVYPFSSSQLPLQLKTELKSKAKLLQNVTVENGEEGVFETWKDYFIPEFLGSTVNAAFCKIKNPEVIRFRLFRKSRRLAEFADEPIIIENEALGYIIKYKLEEFEINHATEITFFSGYPLFIEMETGSKSKKAKWNSKRHEAYCGSQMHFMRSLYNNTLLQDSFELRRMIITPNAERDRVTKFYNPEVTTFINPNSKPQYSFDKEPKGLSNDSLNYYRKVIIQQPEFATYTNVLNADSLVTRKEADYKVVYFDGTVYIRYKLAADNLPATIKLTKGLPIVISKNGKYSETKDMVSGGKWAATERVSNMLPWDYRSL